MSFIDDLIYEGKYSDDLLKSGFFAGAPRSAVDELVEKAQLVSIKKGDIVIHEGDYELTCYVTLRGRYEVSVYESKVGKKRIVAESGPLEILGEISVLTGNPRFATVTCLEDGEALMLTRDDLFEFLEKSPIVKKRVDDDYMSRTLRSTLKKLGIFSLLDDKTIERLVTRATLVKYEKNDLIFKPGEPADAFFLIREGFVKMSRSLDDKDAAFFDSRFDKGLDNPMKKPESNEFIIAYLGKEAYFGERALISHRKRLFTAKASTHVELVRISREDFEALMSEHPEIEEKLRKVGESRYEEEGNTKTFARQEALSWVEDHDLLAGEKILSLDLDTCTRCLHCIETCAKLHYGVSRITHNGIQFHNILIPTSCRHCREPSCMIGCPTGAIQRDKSGEVFHTSACIGCGNCARRCPFKNISIVELKKAVRKMEGEKDKSWFSSLFGWGEKVESTDSRHVTGKTLKKAVKCDMCKGYKHMGCMHNCPTGAIKTIVPSQYFS